MATSFPSEPIRRAFMGQQLRPVEHPGEGILKCRVYWGSHGCDRPRGHTGPHLCLSCWTEDEAGWVGAPPYYGPETFFYGEDAESFDGNPAEHPRNRSQGRV